MAMLLRAEPGISSLATALSIKQAFNSVFFCWGEHLLQAVFNHQSYFAIMGNEE